VFLLFDQHTAMAGPILARQRTLIVLKIRVRCQAFRDFQD
jgi:hypothetical protein